MTPTPYLIGRNQRIAPVPRDSEDYPSLLRDPRGVIWMWEPPDPRATYVVGADPAGGIPGWNRYTRARVPNDNCCASVIRVGRDGAPDVQVAEFAAPIDAEDFAGPLSALGRIYAGSSETGEALVIIEISPGPGLATQRRMIDHYQYTTYFHWHYLDQLAPVQTRWLGFVASQQSVRLLWIRAHNHIARGLFVPRSPWLVEEMRYCVTNPQGWGEATGGRKDDRVRAAMLGIWAAHDWSMQLDFSPPKVTTGKAPPPWQASDISSDRLMDAWEERFSELLES